MVPGWSCGPFWVIRGQESDLRCEKENRDRACPAIWGSYPALEPSLPCTCFLAVHLPECGLGGSEIHNLHSPQEQDSYPVSAADQACWLSD
eukprot:1148063-Pelagomonas_calceolata.AAC.2